MTAPRRDNAQQELGAGDTGKLSREVRYEC